jgi:hypothetical protein
MNFVVVVVFGFGNEEKGRFVVYHPSVMSGYSPFIGFCLIFRSDHFLTSAAGAAHLPNPPPRFDPRVSTWFVTDSLTW